ncbi:putative periplasmic serine endoprotease DegP-like precursor [Rosistilla ulvae]|uniref:Putative periplasmic serine endoprotease DegP-like n=2 Tax=Rosistilla ulvae TaxID=1930277 RepID=A0A517M6K7_9BACT|nr:putative periplasmic serine endoprotease DegP-like precursor [Rosistilla ulvae]
MKLRPASMTTLLRSSVICLTTFCTLLAHTAQTASGSNRDTPVVRVVREASPSVVNIHGHKTVRAGGLPGQGQSFQQVNGMGTGVVIDSRGYVVTNFHVVQDVNDIRVTLADGRPAVARVIAHDLRTDLAVLKIDAREPLPVIRIGTSEDLWVGETVIAIGNAFGYEHTVTQGIVSALHRDVPVNEEQSYTDLIQTSAEINPGNSGGPLLNLDGQMIGINVAVRVGAQGIAFTIPVDQVLDIVSTLIQQKTVNEIAHGIQGVTQWNDDESSFVVTSVSSGSSAEKEGVDKGDRILQINGHSIRNRMDFELAMLELTSRDPIEFEIANTQGDVSLVSLRSQPNPRSNTPRTTPVAQRIWTSFGIQGEPVAEATMQDLNRRMETAYGAGLKITSVRPGSQADRQGMQSGDVLLGIRNWQTSSLNDLDYILRSDEFRSGNQSQFFIIRSNKTMIGYLQVAQVSRRTTR